MLPELRLALLRIIPFIIVLFILRIATKKGKINAENFFLNKPKSYAKMFLWWFAFLLFALIIEFVFLKKGLLEVSSWNHSLVPSILLIFGSVVLAPFVEELLFRGLFLQKLIRLNLNKYAAVVIQAVVFVLMHSFAYENTMTSTIGIVQVFIDGCLFGLARMNTKSIYTSVAMHSTGNLIAVLERFIFG